MITKIIREEVGTTIEAENSFLPKVKCFIGKTGEGNNGSQFELDIEEEGQVSIGCSLVMTGDQERLELLPILKQIVYEMELLNNSN